MNQNQIWINNETYTYKVAKKDEKIIYKDNKNYQKLYLEINNLRKEYQIDGYHLNAKFIKSKEKIINLLKNKEEYQ